MQTKKINIQKSAWSLGYRSSKKELWNIVDWLREAKQIHIEVGSIWDEFNNEVESYFCTVTAPVYIYYSQPVYCSGGKSYKEMLLQGLEEALKLLKDYREQKNIIADDDMIVIAYLKGYGDKGLPLAQNKYRSNLEKYAYALGKQGDYIEEGLTEDEIVLLVRNKGPQKETLLLE